MIKIIINSSVKFPLSVQRIRQIAKQAAALERKLRGTVELNIVNDAIMRDLNRRYRGKDSTTDVLSFSWLETGDKDYLGQIFVSAPQINRQAKEYGVPAAEEFSRMFTHGLLHLVGHDHERKSEAKIMFDLQEKIIAQ
ncbi:MAG: rRNA maturation RNase YbeY [bacterium]|nr:rRNA maturation RNase YbeY [bacterium]